MGFEGFDVLLTLSISQQEAQQHGAECLVFVALLSKAILGVWITVGRWTTLLQRRWQNRERTPFDARPGALTSVR